MEVYWFTSSPILNIGLAKPFTTAKILRMRLWRTKKLKLQTSEHVNKRTGELFTLHRMKLATYLKNGHEQLAFYHNGLLYDTERLHPEIPNSMGIFLNYWDDVLPLALRANAAIVDGNLFGKGTPAANAEWQAPVPFPTSCRDAYAFRQHVATARRNRGLDMIPEFDQFPVFYFTNHNAVQGPGPVSCMPDHFRQLDFELEVAIVICRSGRNIRAEEADEYIGGFMIMNDVSARHLQLQEMKLNLGPAKGKDFATTLGPWLVTPDELEAYENDPPPGHTGKTWNLPMTARVNGQTVSEGNLADMAWTFAEIIERCSYGVTLHPGDVIGSGTVGTGCFLELNGTGNLNDPAYAEQWLQPGDTVELEVEGLGVLSNTIEAEDTDYSLLSR